MISVKKKNFLNYCGLLEIVALLSYTVAVVVSPLDYPGYNWMAQAVSDLTALANRFEKKLHDLELTRTIAMQMAPQIRLVQNNDTMMSDKIQSTIVNTIPLWKSQMVIALGVAHSEQAAKVQREVSDFTNEMLKKNAERLKTVSVNVAKESERGIVDIETLQTTNEQLISTLDEVLQIQKDGRAKRQAADRNGS